ncbi:MAG: protein-disulfide reductase DsbD domain-containing protein [Dongiaceae bacterium]
MRFIGIPGATLAVALSLFCCADRALAAASDWFETPEGAVRLVAAVDRTGTLETIPAGIEFRLEPGWKTYWRSPGDAGLPVSVDWQGSQNLSDAAMSWPAPHRFTLFGLDTFGYGDAVVFPVAVTPAEPGEPLRLHAAVNYLLCEEICIPFEAELVLDLPAGEAAPAPEAQSIDRFQSQVPVRDSSHGIVIEHVTVEGGGTPTIALTARSEIPFIAPDLLVEGTYDWRFPAPELIRAADNLGATLRIVAEPLVPDAPPLDTLPLVLTLIDGTRGVELLLEPGTSIGGSGVDSGSAGAPLVAALLIALLGGLILNLMPCVLPVLSLKLLSVVGHGGGEARAVRRSFLATAAGIVFSFLLLAAVLIALKSAGTTIGWGIQFQQPWFLVAMAAIVTLFAANLAGWFDVALPAWIGNRAGTERSGIAGAFATGMLATLLATPCSAPFVGTAVGFALARGAGEILAIFAVMGVGLALPYLLVSAMPRIATALPRPGRWMVHLRRLLALALIATAVWLLWIVAEIAGRPAALVSGLLLLAVLALLWLRPRLGHTGRSAGTIAAAVLMIAALLPALLPGFSERHRPGGEMIVADDALWQAFDPASIDRLVGEGKTVFVDVTAEWCITCEVNKRLVLERAPVSHRLTVPGVLAMRADWTRPNEAIAQYLATFGRYGIPFNVIYGPGAPDGIALPELLDTGSVLDALDRAAGSS